MLLDRTALIAYGSETGNAHDYAEELGRLFERIHYRALVAKLDGVDFDSLVNYSVMVVVVSTTGQGDLPANARIFWKYLLRQKLRSDALSHVCFTSFGLGDSSYPRFNWAARKLHKRFLQLGATEFYLRGEADEQHEEGLDASFLPWSSGLRKALLRYFPLKEGLSPVPDHTLLEPKWLLGVASTAAAGLVETWLAQVKIAKDQDCTSESHRPIVTLQENHRVTPNSHWQDVRQLTFTAEKPISYGPGDVLTVYPQNSVETVNDMITMMHWNDIADALIEFVPTRQDSERGHYPPSPIHSCKDARITLRHLLIHHLDITAIPRRSFFALVAHFTEDQFHRDRLLEFTDPKYVDEFYDYTTRPRRSLLEVLQEFDSVRIPWQWAAYVLPELRGRQFSIASGGRLKESGDGTARFELLVAIVKYKTVIKKIREGVCTKYLAGLQPGAQLAVSLQRGGLGVSKVDLHVPVLMVGPGTGVAPMRSLIWERASSTEGQNRLNEGHQSDMSNGGARKEASLLFFGGRNKNADYFYKEEWERFQDMASLRVLPAFSRDQASKYYVQDAIKENSQLIYDMLDVHKAIVYVCGSSGKMPRAVRAALAEVIQKHRSADLTENQLSSERAATKYLEDLERAGRYKQETW